MLHYTCDCCGRTIDGDNELRYVVRLEVYAAIDSSADDPDEDRDHLREIQDILEQLDDAEDDAIGEDVYHQTRFDLCSDCRKRFVKNPLGRLPAQSLDFSNN